MGIVWHGATLLLIGSVAGRFVRSADFRDQGIARPLDPTDEFPRRRGLRVIYVGQTL
jgi:hypothetical protein